jgi:SAM-dependent methyltransferase
MSKISKHSPLPESIHTTHKKIPIQEKSVFVGDMIVVNGYKVNRTALRRRFSEGGYLAQETPHFLLFTRSEAPSTILVHWFGPEDMHADIKHYLMYELKPLGLLTQSTRFGEILSGIVGSFFPADAASAWHGYGAKTLQRFLLFLSTNRTPQVFDYYATIGTFANRYQRVCELCVGESFLDVGSESGMLPLIIAERIPFMQQVLGVDIQMDMLNVATELAEEWHLPQVHFRQADILSNTFHEVGQFDTVAALHIIEHFTEAQMYHALINLLQATKHRLILAVPYEQEPETIYEHQQVFTREKLETIGQWCLQQIDHTGRMWCEECDGGLLLIEKRPELLANKTM